MLEGTLLAPVGCILGRFWSNFGGIQEHKKLRQSAASVLLEILLSGADNYFYICGLPLLDGDFFEHQQKLQIVQINLRVCSKGKAKSQELIVNS